MVAWKRGAIGAAILLILAQISGVNAGLSRWLTDTHWRAHASWRPTPFPKDILVIAIDDATIKQFGRLRYWSRGLYGKLLDRLREAKAVGLDILFTEPDESDPDGDARLARAMRAHGRAALVCYEWLPTDLRPISDDTQAEIRDVLKGLPRVTPSLAGRVPSVSSDRLEFPIPLLMNSVAAVGAADVNGDSDGVYRSPVVLKKTRDNALIGHFSLALARLAAGTPPGDPGFNRRGLRLGKRAVPLTDGALWMQPIARRGGTQHISEKLSEQEAGERTPTMSLADALTKPPSAFAGKIILVGETATGTSDVRPNALDSGLRGVELDAEILANLLYLRPVRPLPTLLQWLLIIAAVGLPLWLYQALSPAKANAGALIALAGLLGVMEFSFWGLRWIPLWSPVLIGFAGTTLIMALQRFAQEEALKRQLRQSFSVYVTHELVEAIVANPEIAHEEGTRRRVAVLFSDVRGFTPYCEQHSPEHVVKQMREYADEMTAAVAANDGVLDKFLGDGVMALFGPFLTEDCNISALAVSSALDMLDRLEKLNERWAARAMPAFRIGIGIHVGDAIVGNIGGANRMQYTALGDAVNLASRLQETTKELKARLLVTQEVRDEAEPALLDRAVFASRGTVTVRGLERSVSVYEVSCGESEPRTERDDAQAKEPAKTG